MSNGAIAAIIPGATLGREQKNGEFLLRLLGGLLVANLVRCRYDFVEFLARGCNLSTTDFWVIAAYYAFVLNVFRQIHGLVIVTTRRDTRPGGWFGNFIEIAALVTVVMIPSYLAVYISHELAQGRVLSDGMSVQNAFWGTNISAPSEAKPNSLWILNSYLVVALAYVFWDTADFFKEVGNHKITGWKNWVIAAIFLVICLGIGVYVGYRLYSKLGAFCAFVVGFLIGLLTGIVSGRWAMDLSASASLSLKNQAAEVATRWDAIVLGLTAIRQPKERKDYVAVWQGLLLLTLLVGMWFVDGVESIPLVLTIMCGAYTLLDYSLNRRFYFSS